MGPIENEPTRYFDFSTELNRCTPVGARHASSLSERLRGLENRSLKIAKTLKEPSTERGHEPHQTISMAIGLLSVFAATAVAGVVALAVGMSSPSVHPAFDHRLQHGHKIEISCPTTIEVSSPDLGADQRLQVRMERETDQLTSTVLLVQIIELSTYNESQARRCNEGN